MSDNTGIYEKVRNVPQEALKPINGGRLKGMSDINPMWRIKMLTEMFGVCGVGWKIEITDKRLEKGSGIETVCFVDINLYVKVDGEWSAPIPGMGGSSFVTQEKNGPYTSDECFKMAYTDAISVACKSLGFAADVYFANDRTKYSNQDEGNGAPTASHKPADAPPSAPDNFPEESRNADLEAIERESQKNAGRRAQPDPNVKYVTENQSKMLWAKWKHSQYGNSKDDCLELLSAHLAKHVTDFKLVEASDVNKVIAWLDAHKAA